MTGAEKLFRCYLLGLSTALYFSLAAMIALDCYFRGWEAVFFGAFPNAQILLIACLIQFVGLVPFSKIYARYEKEKYTVRKYITAQRRVFSKWYNSTTSITLVILIGSVVLWLCIEILRGFSDLTLALLATGSRPMLALPVISPIVFVVVRATHRKARDIIDQMSSKID